MLWWLRRFKRADTRTAAQRRADFLALTSDRPHWDPGNRTDEVDGEHSLEAICDGMQIQQDTAGWEALLASLDEALAAADAGEVDGVMDKGHGLATVIRYGPEATSMLAATEDLLRAYRPCVRIELRYGVPDDEDAESRVITFDR